MATWIGLEIFAPDAACPPQLAGFFAALAGMIVGSLAPPAVHHKPTPQATHPRHQASR